MLLASGVHVLYIRSLFRVIGKGDLLSPSPEAGAQGNVFEGVGALECLGFARYMHAGANQIVCRGHGCGRISSESEKPDVSLRFT